MCRYIIFYGRPCRLKFLSVEPTGVGCAQNIIRIRFSKFSNPKKSGNTERRGVFGRGQTLIQRRSRSFRTVPDENLIGQSHAAGRWAR